MSKYQSLASMYEVHCVYTCVSAAWFVIWHQLYGMTLLPVLLYRSFIILALLSIHSLADCMWICLHTSLTLHAPESYLLSAACVATYRKSSCTLGKGAKNQLKSSLIVLPCKTHKAVKDVHVQDFE